MKASLVEGVVSQRICMCVLEVEWTNVIFFGILLSREFRKIRQFK